MRILHSLGSFVNGGVETLLVNVANRQAIAGNEVAIMIVTNKWSPEIIDALDSRIRIYHINKPIGSKNPWYLLKMFYYYKTFNANILHLHSPGAEKLFIPKNKKERRIITIHNETIPMTYSKSVDHYITISKCVKEAFIDKTGYDNCTVCYNGVDNNRFVVKTKYRNKPRHLLFVGRVLFDVKGQDIVLEGLARLSSEIKQDIHLDFWGDGPDMMRMKRMVTDLGLDDVVTICGNKDNKYVAEHICDYDIMIQASRHEGLGISAIEAMISGVPVLVSSAKGFLEVTDNGMYGTIFNHSDVDAFVSSLTKVFNNYRESIEVAKKAIAYAGKKFSLDTYVNQIMNIYKR